jgi:hypothetical protein
VEIDELAVKVMADVARAIPIPGTGPVVEALLGELLQIQDQQMALLTKIEADVQRLVDGPWRTGRRYLREAALPGRNAQQIDQALSRAMESFRQAVDLQPASTLKRATVSLDLAVLCALSGDTELAILYATESEAEARHALEASARARWNQQYGTSNQVRDMTASLASAWTPIPMNLRMKKVLDAAQKVRVQTSQYGAIRRAAAALGAALPDDLPSIEPESKELLPDRIRRQARDWITRTNK